MKRIEYEQRRQALEEAFEAEVATLRAAHQIRLRSLEALWLADPEEDAPPQAAPSMPPPPRLSLPEMTEALEEIFPCLPEVFDKNDVIRLLGWSPPRASLFRALQTLVFQGRLTVEQCSNGRVSNVYRQKALKGEA